jgi:hypothetical protein
MLISYYEKYKHRLIQRKDTNLGLYHALKVTYPQTIDTTKVVIN